MEIRIEPSVDGNSYDVIRLTLPPVRGEFPVGELEGLCMPFIRDQLIAYNVSAIDTQSWTETVDHNGTTAHVDIQCFVPTHAHISELEKSLKAAFAATDENAHTVASGLDPDNRIYLQYLDSFPKVIETALGPLKTWVFTQENAKEAERLYESYDRCFAALQKHDCQMGTINILPKDSRTFLVLVGSSPEHILGVMLAKEHVRGWPLECVSVIAREHFLADYSSYAGIHGSLEIKWIETAARGVGIADGLIRAVQSLPYEVIELEEGGKVPDDYYEKRGFTPDKPERATAGQGFLARALTWNNS